MLSSSRSTTEKSKMYLQCYLGHQQGTFEGFCWCSCRRSPGQERVKEGREEGGAQEEGRAKEEGARACSSC